MKDHTKSYFSFMRVTSLGLTLVLRGSSFSWRPCSDATCCTAPSSLFADCNCFHLFLYWPGRWPLDDSAPAARLPSAPVLPIPTHSAFCCGSQRLVLRRLCFFGDPLYASCTSFFVFLGFGGSCANILIAPSFFSARVSLATVTHKASYAITKDEVRSYENWVSATTLI